MKKIFLLLSIAVFILPSTSWPQTPEKEYYPNGDIKVDWYSEFGDNDLTRKEYYPNNILKNQANYEDGKIDGVYKEYGKDGNLLVELNYKNGVEHGMFREYSFGGALIKEGRYSNGQLDGRQIVYGSDGNILQAIEFRDGLKHGMGKLYYKGGIPKEESPYVDGKLSGVVKFYDEDGRLKAEIQYKDDVRQGPAKEYYPSGALRTKMNFVDDQIDGELIEYYENHGIKKKSVVVNGKVVQENVFDKEGNVVNDLSSGIHQPLSEKPEGPVAKLEEGLLRNLSGTGSSTGDVILIGVLIIIFLFLGVYIGKILNVSTMEDADYEKNLLYRKTDGVRRKEFNPLHSDSEKMYRSLIETVKSGIFMSEANGRIFYGNHTFAQIFGFKSKQDVIGLNVNDIFRCADHGEKKLLKVMGESNEIRDFEFKFRLENSEVVVLSVSANRIFDEQGKASGLQGVVLDITEKKQLEDDVLNEKKKLESILEFFENIESVREQEKLIGFGIQGIAQILEARTCIIAMNDPGTQTLSVLGAQGTGLPPPQRITFDAKNPVFSHVLKAEKTLFVENIEYDKRFAGVARPPFLKRSFMIAPLEAEDKINGMIVVSDKQEKFGAEVLFSEVDSKLLTIIAGKVSVAMENITLYNDLNLQTVIDPITKIYNYRLLSKTLDREINRYQREQSPFFVFMMDVDDFKSYNDTFGHLEGDELLKNLGMILRNNVRQTDVACRYAGDEFCIVLTNTTLEGAATPAQKIIKAVENFKFKRTVTISIGVASYEGGMTKKDIISKADKALYEAKHAGKNKYVISS